MDAWEESDGKLLFRTRHEMRKMSIYLIVVGAVLLAVMLIALFFAGTSDAAGLIAQSAGIIGGSVAVAGVICIAMVGTTVVDREAGVIECSEGSLLFSDIGFVLTTQIMVKTGQNESPIWVVAVVPDREVRDQHIEAFVNFREILGKTEMPGTMADHAAETLAMMRQIEATDQVIVGSYFDAARAWRASEKLARTIGVPILEIGGEPRLRPLDQLDAPLKTLLVREILPTRNPGPPTPDLEVQPGDTLRLSFVRYNPLFLLVLFPLGLLGCIPFAPELWFVLLPIALLLAAPLPLAAIGYGRQTITIDQQRLSFTAFRKEVVLDLDKIEMIREDERTKSLVFITDETHLVAHPPSVDARRWLRLRIEGYLKDLGEG